MWIFLIQLAECSEMLLSYTYLEFNNSHFSFDIFISVVATEQMNSLLEIFVLSMAKISRLVRSDFM